MKLILLISSISLFLPALAVAACEIPPVPDKLMQKYSISEVVKDTEKLPVDNVEITAPGLAVVSYGAKPVRKVIVTFRYECMDKFTPEQIVKNPTGFWVNSYVPVNK